MTVQPESLTRWAAKVLVNSNEACDHGRKEVGLPSQIARFSKSITAMTAQPKNKDIGILNAIGMGATFNSPRDHMNVQVTEWDDLDTKDTCNINLTTVVPALNEKWMGPAVKISLPSYSGHTEHNPNLLKYSCQIECRVRAVKPAVVSGPSPILYHDRVHYSDQRRCNTMDSTAKEHIDNGKNLIMSVMLSKPILALEFNCLKMQVHVEGCWQISDGCSLSRFSSCYGWGTNSKAEIKTVPDGLTMTNLICVDFKSDS
ncbi:hypothetical protein F2P56_029714 [Juglans regia]|uniref:Uncharacterized protein n=1 Tax=Juglans regia TaxID=51240 RepID=A0A833WYF3_JUGRE|nr:hypothetical protein F2P56_029714 [Juglans regia]